MWVSTYIIKCDRLVSDSWCRYWGVSARVPCWELPGEVTLEVVAAHDVFDGSRELCACHRARLHCTVLYTRDRADRSTPSKRLDRHARQCVLYWSGASVVALTHCARTALRRHTCLVCPVPFATCCKHVPSRWYLLYQSTVPTIFIYNRYVQWWSDRWGNL